MAENIELQIDDLIIKRDGDKNTINIVNSNSKIGVCVGIRDKDVWLDVKDDDVIMHYLEMTVRK